MTDQFGAAVLVLFDPSAPAGAAGSAEAFLSSLLAQPQSWTLLVDQFARSSQHEIRFFCAQKLVDLISGSGYRRKLSPAERAELRQAVVSLLRDVVACSPLPAFVLNKYAHILLALCERDFPSEWPHLFDEVLSSLDRGLPCVDVFLKLLEQLEQQVVDRAVERSPELHLLHTGIKDNMRLLAMPQLVQALYLIVGQFHASQPELACRALGVMAELADWIDIQMLLSPHIQEMMQFALSSSSLRASAGRVLVRIMEKGMSFESKMALVQRLQVLPVIEQVCKSMSSAAPEFVKSIATMTQSLVLEILSIDSLDRSFELADPFVECALQFMACPDIEISSEVLQAVNTYVSRVKKQVSVTSVVPELVALRLRTVVALIVRCIRYPSHFRFGFDDEEELSFVQYRRSVLTIVRNVSRASPLIIESFLKQSVVDFGVAGVANVPEVDAEAFVSFAVQYAEGVTEKQLRDPGGVFLPLLFQRLVCSDLRHVFMRPHAGLATSYFEFITRFARCFLDFPGSLGTAIADFSGMCGLRNPSAWARSRISHFLFRFVKELRVEMAPSVGEVVRATSEFCTLQRESDISSGPVLGTADQMWIFESYGLLLSQRGDRAETAALFEGIVAPILERLREILRLGLQLLQLPATSMWAAAHISAVGSVMKHFQVSSSRPWVHLRSSLLQLSSFLLSVFDQCGIHVAPVRDKIFFIFHRMIEAVGVDAIPLIGVFLSKATAVAQSNVAVFPEVCRTLMQTVLRFKSQSVAAIGAVFPQLLEDLMRLCDAAQVFSVTSELALRDEMKRIAVENAKALLLAVSALTTSDCAGVYLLGAGTAGARRPDPQRPEDGTPNHANGLLSTGDPSAAHAPGAPLPASPSEGSVYVLAHPEPALNPRHVQMLVHFLMVCCQFPYDVGISRLAVGILAKLAEEIPMYGAGSLGDSLLQWMAGEGAATSVQLLLRPEFDLKDAEHNRVLKHVAALHRTLCVRAVALLTGPGPGSAETRFLTASRSLPVEMTAGDGVAALPNGFPRYDYSYRNNIISLERIQASVANAFGPGAATPAVKEYVACLSTPQSDIRAVENALRNAVQQYRLVLGTGTVSGMSNAGNGSGSCAGAGVAAVAAAGTDGAGDSDTSNRSTGNLGGSVNGTGSTTASPL